MLTPLERLHRTWSMANRKKFNSGLLRWAKGRKTSTIASHLEGKEGIDNPRALAASMRREAIGDEQFEANQREARAKKRGG